MYVGTRLVPSPQTDWPSLTRQMPHARAPAHAQRCKDPAPPSLLTHPHGAPSWPPRPSLTRPPPSARPTSEPTDALPALAVPLSVIAS
jgi:hypothetical protein